MIESEIELLAWSKTLMPALPVDRLHGLIVEEMGKNFSGTGADTNIIGRLRIQGEAEMTSPNIRYVSVLDLSEESHGNATGIGLVDFVTQKLIDKVDRKATYLNNLTTTFVTRAFLPTWYDTEQEALETMMFCLRSIPPEEVRLVHVPNTLYLTDCFVSEAVLRELDDASRFSLVHAVAPADAVESDQQEDMAPLDQKNVSYYYNLEKRSIRKSKYQEALAAISKGQALDPAYLPFMKQKALVLIRLNRRAEAAQVIDLALGGLPNDLELNTLFVDNTLAQDHSQSAAEEELTSYFKKMNPAIVPELIANIAFNSTTHDAGFGAVLASAVAAKVLPPRDQAVLSAYLNKKPSEAAARLRAEGAPGKSDALFSTLTILTAEAYQRARNYAEADIFYKKAIAQGYDSEKAHWIEGQIYVDLHDSLGAAQTFEEHWRAADNPSVWAVLAAKAYSGAGRHGGGQA